MEQSEMPVYYKGDDGIYRPMVDIRQLPSTSSGVYKTTVWNGSSAIFQQHSSSNSSSVMSKQQTNASNLEVSQNTIRQSENTVDIQHLPSTSSGINKSMDRFTRRHQLLQERNSEVNQGEQDQLENAIHPEKSIGVQVTTAVSRIIAKHVKNYTHLEGSEKVQVESVNDVHQRPSSIPIELKQQTNASVLKGFPRKKEQTVSTVVIQQIPSRNSGISSPLTKIKPEQLTKTVNMKRLQVEKKQVGNVAKFKQSPSENSVICSPMIFMQKSLSLPEFFPAKKQLTKTNHLPSFQSEIDLVGNGCATKSGMVVSDHQNLGNLSPYKITSRHVQITKPTNIQSLLLKTSGSVSCSKPKKKTEGIVQISNDKQEKFRNVITTEQSHLQNREENILNESKQTKKTCDVNVCRGKNKAGNMVVNIQQLPSTSCQISKSLESKKPKQQRILNNIDTSLGENKIAKNMVHIQQPASSNSEIYRPLICDVQKSLSRLESLLPNERKTIGNNFASCTGGMLLAENVGCNQLQSSTNSGINSRVTNNSLKTDVDIPSKTSGIHKTVLWNLPDSLILPDLSLLKREQELDDDNKFNAVMDSGPDCSEKDLLHGVEYRKLRTLYFHIMGTNSKPADTLREIGLLTVRTMLCSIERKQLINLIEKDKFVNFNRLVLWGFNRRRPRDFLFSTVKPDNYSFDDTKTQLLKYVKALHFKTKQGKNVDKSNHIECQACHKRINSFSSFVDHLNRDTSEVTYMCVHCGYLRFTNMCAFVYHILADNYMKPTLEYCLVCGLFCESLEGHLMDSKNLLNNKKVQCSLCEFTAFSICSFKFHLSYHIEELPYICPECGEYFSFKEHLEEHMKNTCFMNYKFKYYFCTSESCGMIFSYLENFYSHISTEHYERRVICTICHTMFSAQREFLAHRTKDHPGEVCSYNVYNYCTLCPNSTFRAMSQQKHLTNHGLENKCSTVVYKCQCDFQTRFKLKFIQHKKAASPCHRKTFHRPQVMKICQNCFDVQSFNYMTPYFICEECQQILQPSLSLLNYYCELCHLVIDYCWNQVLDHFFVFHKRVDLLSLSLHTMLIVSKNKVVPGRYLSQRSITEVNVEFMNKFVKELSGNRNNTTLDTESNKSESSSVVDLTKDVGRIRVRSPSSINASLSSINPSALLSCTFLDNSGINNKNKAQIPSKTLENTKLNAFSLNTTTVPTNKGSKNTPKDIFFCRKCNYTSCVQSEMARHCQSHNPIEYNCSECDKSFKTSSARNNHLSNDHGLHLLAANQGNFKSVQHGEVQKILKQQIQGKLSIKQARKKPAACKQAEDI